MNFFKTLNELLPKTFFLALCLILSQIGYGQRGPTIDNFTPIPTPPEPSIDVAISDVQYVETNGEEIVYNATLDFDILFGGVLITQAVTEYSFDLRLSGFDLWTLPIGVFGMCNGVGTYEVIQDDVDGNLFHLSTYFPDGISPENLCGNMAIAASAIVLELPDFGEEGMSITADCWDPTHEIDATVEITNASYSLVNGQHSFPFNDVYYEESFLLPSCIKGSLNAGKFDVNIAIGADQNYDVFVDVYFRFNKNQLIDYVKKGDIYLMYTQNHFEDPTFHSSDLNITEVVTSSNVLTRISFDEEMIEDNIVDDSYYKQIYVGRLLYNRIDLQSFVETEFKVVFAQFEDQDNNSLSSNVPNGDLLDVEYVTYDPDSIPNHRTSLSTNQSLKVYPNPAKHKLHIKTVEKLDNDTVLQLYSPDGKLVKTLSTNSMYHNLIELDVSDLHKGVYVLNLTGLTYAYQTKVLID